MAGQSPVPLPPFWRLMLMSDGSPTRHLQSLTGDEVEVDLITMQPETEIPPQCPNGAQDLVVAPYLRRQVWKHCGEEALMWAESWWNQQTAQEIFHDRNVTIWRNLTRDLVELNRDIDQLGQVRNPRLQQRFGRTGPFWSRSYRLFKGGQVLTVIREVFSPALESYLDGKPHPGPGER